MMTAGEKETSATAGASVGGTKTVGEGVGSADGWYVGEGDGSTVGIAVGWCVGEGVGFTEKGLGVNLFGNGGEESTLGDSVGCVSGQIGIPLDGLGVFGAFEGFAVDGFRVGGLLLVGMNVGRLLTGLSVGFLLFGLFFVGEMVGAGVETCPVGVAVGTLVGDGDGLNEGRGVGE